MSKVKLNVTGMSCAACSAHVEKALNKTPGVQQAVVSLMTNSAAVTYDEKAVSPVVIHPEDVIGFLVTVCHDHFHRVDILSL